MARGNSTGQTTLSPDTYITIGDAAEYLDVTDRTVRNLVSRGELQAFRLSGRMVRLRAADVAALLSPIPTAGPGDHDAGA